MAAAAPTMQRHAGGRGGPMANPALFNRVARLQRHSVGAIAHANGVAGKYSELPNVGYHYRVFAQFDLDLGTSSHTAAGRFLSGHNGANTVRFPCPTNILRQLRYTLNISSPVYASDGYGNYILQLIASRGLSPWTQVASTDIGRNQKERAVFCIYNATTGSIAKPDDAVAIDTNYKLRGVYLIPLTLGEAASAGLIPVQDIRITPQVFMDMGDLTDICNTASDFPSAGVPTGNYNLIVDYFTVPSPAVRPDTSYVMQTRQDLVSVNGTGDQIYRPQIGGVILRTLFTVWNGSKAVTPATIDNLRLRIQQGIILENITPHVHIMDERRWYSKLLPDEVYVFDHLTGFGDPTLPSLRDRITSSQLTRLEYILQWNTGVSPSATSELRNYIQQLVPLPRVM